MITRANEQHLRKLISVLVEHQPLLSAGAGRDWVDAIIKQPQENIPEMLRVLNGHNWGFRRRKLTVEYESPDKKILATLVELKEFGVRKQIRWTALHTGTSLYTVLTDLEPWCKANLNNQLLRMFPSMTAAYEAMMVLLPDLSPEKSYFFPVAGGTMIARNEREKEFRPYTADQAKDLGFDPDEVVVLVIEDTRDF
jgi:hypothetical protein